MLSIVNTCLDTSITYYNTFEFDDLAADTRIGKTITMKELAMLSIYFSNIL